MTTFTKHWNSWGWIAALLLLITLLAVVLNAAVKTNEVAYYKLTR